MNAEHLARMANEIGTFFAAGNEQPEAVRLIADHLRRFWDPRMRKQIIAYVDAGGDHLDGPVRQAIDLLRSSTQAS